jgi:SAM-dependent methyltransferase
MSGSSLRTRFSPAADGKSAFYNVDDVPVNSVLLVRTREDALDFPTATIDLAFCPETGFITNPAFREDLVSYNAEYEETQGFSGTFSAFHRRLAEDLIERYDLRDKTVLEIGCGKGEFLTLLCELGPNEGVGFDPAYRPERNTHPSAERITFVRDFYSEDYADHAADFVCCKMTLEHIPDVADFVGMVRRAVGDREETVVFFQVPDVRRVLRDVAFWDVYHEHCSYFSAGSLGRLFRSQGFEVLSLWTDYDDQYLMIEARPAKEGSTPAPHPDEEPVEELAAEVDRFAAQAAERLDGWRRVLRARHRRGDHVALWGGGSKAVAFLTTLGITDEVGAVVDINPFKQGAFLPGTGHEVVGPNDLAANPPDVVLIMNPIYHDEIQADLQKMGLDPAIWHVDADPAELEAAGLELA